MSGLREYLGGSWLYPSLKAVKEAVSEARAEALSEGQKEWDYKYLPSRGIMLCTAAADGSQCGPNIEAECPYWNGSAGKLNALLSKVIANYPEVAEVYLAGGYDGADSPYGYREGNYEPQVASWKVAVWKRA